MHLPDYPGATMISRGPMPKDLGEIVEKALGDKLPKLVATTADKRVLLVERQHISLGDTRILTEIKRLAHEFPQLKDIDEVCIVDTSIWESEHWVYFRRLDERCIVETMAFKNGTGATV